MKKFIYVIILLAIVGAALSGVLTLEHYYPGMSINPTSCKDSITSPCTSINQSEYSAILGIPVAAFGLLFYLLILFLLLIADYAAERYYLYFLAIALPLSAISVIFDIFLIIVLIKLNMFCTLCILSYLINILILITLLFWVKNIKGTLKISLKEIFKSILEFGNLNSDRKAVLSLFIIFVFFLSFAIFSSSYILRIKTYSPKPPRYKIEAFLNKFFSLKQADTSLPESKMVLGNPEAPVSIVVFTDFLCSACYKFFLVEKYIFSKFQDKIKITYYNYPLDNSCNQYINATRYKNSCIASRALISSAFLENFEKYLVRHFQNYSLIARGYNRETSIKIASDFIDKNSFIRKIDSPETLNIIERDTRIAKELGINATPTIFINGRKMVGVLPKEVFEAIIERELQK